MADPQDLVVKHLEMVQATVARMSTNSFLLKGWSVGIVAAIFALAGKDSSRSFAVLAFLPALVFWGLDAYFLREERLYRRLFDDVRASLRDPQGPGAVEPFCMRTTAYEQAVPGWGRTLVAESLWPFHLTVLAIVALVLLFL